MKEHTEKYKKMNKILIGTFDAKYEKNTQHNIFSEKSTHQSRELQQILA